VTTRPSAWSPDGRRGSPRGSPMSSARSPALRSRSTPELKRSTADSPRSRAAAWYSSWVVTGRLSAALSRSSARRSRSSASRSRTSASTARTNGGPAPDGVAAWPGPLRRPGAWPLADPRRSGSGRLTVPGVTGCRRPTAEGPFAELAWEVSVDAGSRPVRPRPCRRPVMAASLPYRPGTHENLEDCPTEVHDLRAQLETRPVTDQAKGLLIAQHRVHLRGCLPGARRGAQHENRKLRDTARSMVDGRPSRLVVSRDAGDTPPGRPRRRPRSGLTAYDVKPLKVMCRA
jgi:hypothetical protein